MTYFNRYDHHTLIALDGIYSDDAIQHVYKRMVDLHQMLYRRLKANRIDLHPVPNLPGSVSNTSAATPLEVPTFTLTYMRDPSEARDVEAFMGRDALSSPQSIEPHRHPVIELRLTPEHFAIELVISPSAWYDQQNFVGKLSVQHYRPEFYRLLADLDDEYKLGFWGGIHLNDMHLNTDHLPPMPVLFEFLDTFADRRDWIRIGRWYEPEDPHIHQDHIVDIAYDAVTKLHSLAAFIQWTSANNFHNFYKKLATY